MAEHHNEIPPRPEGWKMDYTGMDNVTNYWGFKVTESRLEKDKRNLSEKWDMFREMFRSQEERPLGGHHNSFNPPLDQIEWKETNP